MKISLAWLADHIMTMPIGIHEQLVKRFNQTTAEIEQAIKIQMDLKNLFLAYVVACSKKEVVVFIPELNQQVTMAARLDAFVDYVYMICIRNKKWYWATLSDVGGHKEGYLPALLVDQNMMAGLWKNVVEGTDYIYDIDNKSITNRPDLWGHRGIAREIAALFDLELKSLASFVVSDSAETTEKNPFTISIDAPDACFRFSAAYVPQICMQPSPLALAIRLARVESKPMNAVVDITNYVMFDLGYPMHVFDADCLPRKHINVRWAHAREKLTVLDGQKIELTSHDLVIAEGDRALSLAGVIGGIESGVTNATKNILFEAACFDATIIRRMSQKYKKRTEASSRFEKGLDAHHTAIVLKRALALGMYYNCMQSVSIPIVTQGKVPLHKPISIQHIHIQDRIGITLSADQIQHILERLECTVTLKGSEKDRWYEIMVPTFRATKDLQIAEDIIEEVVRFIGYDHIARVLPAMERASIPVKGVYRERLMKWTLVHALAMKEIYSYALFDEVFLNKIKWQPSDYLTVKHAVSEHWQRLVTTLIPHLLKAVSENSMDCDQIRFFESARTWKVSGNGTVKEHKILGGIFFDKKQPINFYNAKADIMKLMHALGVSVEWDTCSELPYAWCMPYQTAYVRSGEHILGYAGMIDALFLSRCTEGSAFCFELDVSLLLTMPLEIKRYDVPSKYPDVVRDISILVPLGVMVKDVEHVIISSDECIKEVMLIDFFQKSEWINQKALTFRYVIRDFHKTLTGEEIDAIHNNIVRVLHAMDAKIR